MRIFYLIIFTIVFSGNIQGQIKMEDYEASERLTHNYGRAIDSTISLMNNCLLTYSHNTLFKCIHITDTAGAIHLVDLRYRDHHSGYMKFFKDDFDSIIFLRRGNGAGNPIYKLQISKYDGLEKLLGEYEPL